MMRTLFNSLIFLCSALHGAGVMRTASVHFEVVHQEVTIGEGLLEVEALIDWEGNHKLNVILNKIKMQTSSRGVIREFDTSEEAFWPIRWWRLRQLRRAMGAPLHFSLNDEGVVMLLDADLEERFGSWPHVYRFVGDSLGQVLFCREFALHGRKLEKEMLIIEPIYSDAEAPLAQFTVEEADAEHVKVVYSSEWSGEGREGHFAGYMEWQLAEPLLYNHEGLDVYCVGERRTHLRREIRSRSDLKSSGCSCAGAQ